MAAASSGIQSGPFHTSRRAPSGPMASKTRLGTARMVASPQHSSWYGQVLVPAACHGR